MQSARAWRRSKRAGVARYRRAGSIAIRATRHRCALRSVRSTPRAGRRVRAKNGGNVMLKRTRIARAILLALGGWSAATVLHAQDATLDRVEITGSSIKRIEGETALPVQILTREDIQRTGASTVEQLLQTVSAAASSGALPAASASGATTLGISAVSLRGLTSLRTLVLINGKRITPYGYGFTNDSVSVDVNAIPLAAIDRVEILKDGA